MKVKVNKETKWNFHVDQSGTELCESKSYILIMKRRSLTLRTKVGELVEKRNALMTNSMSTSLLSLPPELVVMVASYLDVSSYLALAASSNALLDILVSQLQWKALLQRTKMNNDEEHATFQSFENFMEQNLCHKVDEERVNELALFLKSLEDPDNKLLLALLHTICERFPPENEAEVVSLSCPCAHLVHQVSPSGFALLEQAEVTARGTGAEPQQKLVKYKGLKWTLRVRCMNVLSLPPGPCDRSRKLQTLKFAG